MTPPPPPTPAASAPDVLRRPRAWLAWVVGAGVLAAMGVLALTLVFQPEASHPAFDAAVSFANAAGQGDDAVAHALLSDDLRAWVASHCPDGRASACVQSYTPPAWGGMLRAVFRRAVPRGDDAFDVDVIATYAQDVGFSGVCMSFHVAREADGVWRVQRWAGYIHCGDPASRTLATDDAAPNRAPA